MFELKGKTALVTGAAKRIGRAVSVGLAKQGTNVVIHYGKSESEARALQHEITDLGVESWLIQADFHDPKSSSKVIEQAFEKSGRLDVLVNNASIFGVSAFDDVKLDDINVNLLINTWTPFQLSRDFARKAEYGKIINLLDTRIAGYDFNHFAYSVSKKMLGVLTESLALKLAPRVTVNGIAPGLILPPEGKDISYLEQKKEAVPLKRYGSVSDVVETVLFLLRSDFVTGQVVFVDGGTHLLKTAEGL